MKYVGSMFGGYEQLTYEQYEAATGNATHPKANLRKLINDYDLQAAQICHQSWQLKKKCP